MGNPSLMLPDPINTGTYNLTVYILYYVTHYTSYLLYMEFVGDRLAIIRMVSIQLNRCYIKVVIFNR